MPNYRKMYIKSELCEHRNRCEKDAMGQCVSKKAAKALGQHRANMRKHQMFYESPEVEEKIVPSKQGSSICNTNNRGISSSTFGFKKRTNNILGGGGAIVSANSSAAKRLANSNQTADNDPNGNNELVDEDQRAPLTCNAVPSGRTTPRIPPPKKEPNATRQVSRFGFRQPPGSRYKVADINDTARPTYMDNEIGNSYDNRKIQGTGALDSNRNRGSSADNGKFMLQATQLPKPVSVRIMDTKTAKTLANNNRKISGMNPSSDESSKDGSSYLTEDSGIGSVRYEKLNGSPKFGSSYRPRRTLNMVVTGNKFDVLDGDLPNNVPLRPSTSGSTTGTTRFVHKRAMEYERNLERDHRKISVTSSEVSTSDYADEEYVPSKTMFLKPIVTSKWFLKSKQTPDDSSPPTSDDQMWTNGGEAMAIAETADDLKCGFSSSDESKDHAESFNRKEKERNKNKKSSSSVAAAFDNLMTASKTHTLHKYDIKQVLLTIEDPSYAAVAAVSARQYNSLLSEEPSPEDSLFNTFSISEKNESPLNRTLTATSPIILVENTPLTEDKSLLYNENKFSEDANDKQQPNSSPGTPTNGSNSMSLSEGRDFLIDDEIADQPGLLIDDTITNNTTSETATTSMASEMTLVDATPKSKRKIPTDGWMESPLLSRRKQSSRLRSRAGSLDTLSPCESIASDDFMMDYSISSGIDDINDIKSERNSGAFVNDDWPLRSADISKNDLRDWSSLLSGGSVKSLTGASTRPTPGATNITPHRLLRSRANTPINAPQAIRCSLDTLQHTPRSTARPQHLPRSNLAASSTSSSVHNSHTSLHLLRGTGGGTRSSSSSMTGGYDSDESATSLRLERSVQSGMIQDAMALKTMLFRLKRVLQENMDEDILLKSETHNPFDPASLSLMTLQNLYNNSVSVPVTSSGTAAITNGHVFGNTCLNNNGTIHTLTSSAITTPDQQQQQIHLSSIVEEQRLELADLRRQVLYQQGQLEDRDKEVQGLREDMTRLMRVYENGGSSTRMGFEDNGGVVVDNSNATTQTDRIRPISCGPAILDATATGNGSLVSATEVSSSTPNSSMTSRSDCRPLLPVTPRSSHHHVSCNNDTTPISRSSRRPPLRHGSSRLSAPLCVSSPATVTTPVMPVVASSIPRRSCSRSRT